MIILRYIDIWQLLAWQVLWAAIFSWKRDWKYFIYRLKLQIIGFAALLIVVETGIRFVNNCIAIYWSWTR